MSSGEDPKTWEYFDRPVSDYPVMGRAQPYYMNKYGHTAPETVHHEGKAY